MSTLRINGFETEAAPGATILDAARALGVEIPTLCHCREIDPVVSCMVCVVKDATSGKTMPACAALARDGMDIITEDEELRGLRRDTLQLLLNEHAGDCEGPCVRACPAGLNIPRMLRRLEAGDEPAAAAMAREALIFPAILGRLCGAPCEGACRRGRYDAPLAIREAHGGVAERHPDAAPTPAPSLGKSAAVIGSGLAGLAAAAVCMRSGMACTVYEAAERLCPALRGQAPDALFDAEFAVVEAWGVQMRLGVKAAAAELPLLMTNPTASAWFNELLNNYDAIILAAPGAPAGEAPGLYWAREEKMPVRAVAAGKRAAFRVLSALSGDAHNDQRRFNSKLGILDDAALDAYAVERKRETNEIHGDAPSREAARCLHCDCLKPHSCLLRRHAETYGAHPSGAHLYPRPKMAPMERFGAVLFEPGKCIKCGVCVEITRQRGQRPGMTFTGRGMHSRVRGALGASLAEALGGAAEACVRACPTGALAFNAGEDDREA